MIQHRQKCEYRAKYSRAAFNKAGCAAKLINGIGNNLKYSFKVPATTLILS